MVTGAQRTTKMVPGTTSDKVMSTRTGSVMNFNKNLCYNELDKIVFAQIIF